MRKIGDRAGLATQSDLLELEQALIEKLGDGSILVPSVAQTQVNIAGGVNHCPNSDLSYSTQAATVAGTLPADAVDANFEAWRCYRQGQDTNVTVDAAHALKSVDHSLYAGDEGANAYKPIWNRVSGWIEFGSSDPARQHDVIFQLLNKPVGPGQLWFFLCRLVSLTADTVPDDVQLAVGVWQRGSSEGYATGSPFDLQYTIEGRPGSISVNYRVLAKTDSGVSILSNILNVPNAPDAYSALDYVKLFYFAGPGFIEFEIYREIGGVFHHLYNVRNTTDFQYNDTGEVHIGGVQGWPASPSGGDSPQAYAATRNVRLGEFNGAWALNQLSVRVPSTYDSSATDPDGQFLRIQLTAPTAVDRQIGIDRIWFSTTFNEWAPDPPIKFADETFAIPSVSPASGNQGSGDGVFDPPMGGSGGGVPCILSDMPVLTNGGWWRRFWFKPAAALMGIWLDYFDELVGEFDEPYFIESYRKVARSEYYQLGSANGVFYECTPDHRLCLNVDERRYIRARDVVVGETQIHSWERRWWFWSRKVFTTVTSKVFVPAQCEVVDISLRHSAGRSKVGEGHYVAGWSPRMDRGLFSSNVKPPGLEP